jgi:hypothetical protein
MPKMDKAAESRISVAIPKVSLNNQRGQRVGKDVAKQNME